MHGESPRLLSINATPEWVLPEAKLKRYPQFDAVISTAEATEYATTPASVARHPFMPFLEFDIRHNRFAAAGQIGKQKTRTIRCAARRDSYIYSYYRHLLSDRYEAELERRQIGHCVLAYRKLKTCDGAGKANAHFAVDAFDAMKRMGNCTVTTLDITSFFDNIDHERLWDNWRKLLVVDRLPSDHYAVFRSITEYATVPREPVLRRLGYFGVKEILPNGRIIEGYLKPLQPQLCSSKTFRQLIAGGAMPSLITKNRTGFGIPQGSPISDILANLYMLDFDTWMNAEVTKAGGVYFRYSDDIIIITPGANKKHANRWIKIATHFTNRYSTKLTIAPHKTTVHTLKMRKAGHAVERVRGTTARNGVEYLGFRYDGRSIFFRDSTLANLHRKIARTARALARQHARRYADKSADELVASFPYDDIVTRFGRVENFRRHRGNKRKWSFWTYAKRSMDTAEASGPTLRRQLRRLKPAIRKRMESEIRRVTASPT